MILVGIDVAKSSHQAAFYPENPNLVKPVFQKFNNSAEGFEFLTHILEKFGEEFKIGMESTGNHWLPLYHHLKCKGFSPMLLNPLQTKRHSNYITLRDIKTDKLDAKAIACLLDDRNLIQCYVPSPEIQRLRMLVRARIYLIDNMSNLKRKIRSNLDFLFPELESMFSDLFLKSSKRLLSVAPTPDKINDMDTDALEQLLKESSKGNLGPGRAEKIKDAARNSIGVDYLFGIGGIIVNAYLEIIEVFEQKIKELEALIEASCKDMEDYNNLISIKGIGKTSAAAIIGEIGDISRFGNIRKLTAYAGIDPPQKESGNYKAYNRHISKRGSATLRRTLWQCAEAAITCDPTLYAVYDRYRSGGKKHKPALIAVAQRLLKRIYVVLNDKRPLQYD